MADLLEGDGTTLIVEAADIGPGVPDKLLATTLDLFAIIRSRGTGLSLAIRRHVADAHRAHLLARNTVGPPGYRVAVEFSGLSGRPTRIAP